MYSSFRLILVTWTKPTGLFQLPSASGLFVKMKKNIKTLTVAESWHGISKDECKNALVEYSVLEDTGGTSNQLKLW
jgi:hypothetical protein